MKKKFIIFLLMMNIFFINDSVNAEESKLICKYNISCAELSGNSNLLGQVDIEIYTNDKGAKKLILNDQAFDKQDPNSGNWNPLYLCGVGGGYMGEAEVEDITESCEDISIYITGNGAGLDIVKKEEIKEYINDNIAHSTFNLGVISKNKVETEYPQYKDYMINVKANKTSEDFKNLVSCYYDCENWDYTGSTGNKYTINYDGKNYSLDGRNIHQFKTGKNLLKDIEIKKESDCPKTLYIAGTENVKEKKEYLYFTKEEESMASLSCKQISKSDYVGDFPDSSNTNNNINNSENKVDQDDVKLYEVVKCGDNELPKDLVNLMSTGITILQILVPLILIVLGMLDFTKATTLSSEEEMKKARQKFVRRLIAGAAVFLIVAIVKVAFGIVGGDADNAIKCIDVILNGTKS